MGNLALLSQALLLSALHAGEVPRHRLWLARWLRKTVEFRLFSAFYRKRTLAEAGSADYSSARLNVAKCTCLKDLPRKVAVSISAWWRSRGKNPL
jgi:hypothetical protein